MFYISALVLGVIAGVFIATIVSSCQRNRSDELYNRLQKGGNLDNSLKHNRYNGVNVNSVLDKDDLWSDKKQVNDDSDTSIDEYDVNSDNKDLVSVARPSGIPVSKSSAPVFSTHSNKGKKVYIAGPGMFCASQFHGGAPEGIATIEVDEDQVAPMVKMVEQYPDFIRQAFAMTRKMVITVDELRDIWEILSGRKGC